MSENLTVPREARRATLRMACDDYLAHLQIERGLSPNTVAAYRRDLDRYGDFLARRGRASLGEVRPGDVTDYVIVVRDGSDGRPALATTSTARAVAAVRGLHRYAYAEGVTDHDPAARVRPPAQGRRLPHPISVDQVARLLATPPEDSPLGLRDRALLELLYATGARISEIVALDVDDIADLRDPATQVASLRVIGKGGKERLVPVGSYARAALAAYLVRARPGLASGGRTASPALFLNTLGRRLSRQSAWAVLQTAAERANLADHVSPHTLRHSFATHLLSGGADVRVVQELLGHASVTTTQIYTLVTPESLRETYLMAHPRAR